MSTPLTLTASVTALALLLSACSRGPSEADQQACSEADAVRTLLSETVTVTDPVEIFHRMTRAADQLMDAARSAEDPELAQHLLSSAGTILTTQTTTVASGGYDSALATMSGSLDAATDRCKALGVTG